ncbi:hypothetical protein ElyMa_004125600, partial [Elysia marginata]
MGVVQLLLSFVVLSALLVVSSVGQGCLDPSVSGGCRICPSVFVVPPALRPPSARPSSALSRVFPGMPQNLCSISLITEMINEDDEDDDDSDGIDDGDGEDDDDEDDDVDDDDGDGDGDVDDGDDGDDDDDD